MNLYQNNENDNNDIFMPVVVALIIIGVGLWIKYNS